MTNIMKTRFFTLATLALALAACNNDNENLNGDPVAAQFTANIAPAEPPGLAATVSASPTSATIPSTATCLSS